MRLGSCGLVWPEVDATSVLLDLDEPNAASEPIFRISAGKAWKDAKAIMANVDRFELLDSGRAWAATWSSG